VIEGPAGGPYRKDFEREPPQANKLKCFPAHAESSLHLLLSVC
jgi:hypothetical protein